MSGRVLRTIGPIFKNSMLSAAILFYSPMNLQRGFARPIAQSAVQRSALAFDVVSIRRNSGDDRPWGFYPDSYRAIDMPIWRTISYAYFPMRFHDREWIRNAPSWVFDDKYDLVAKVAPEDVNAWQALKKQQPAADNPELQSMFQGLLKDRFKLRVHHIPVEVDGYALVAASKLKLSPGTPDSSSVGAIMEVDGGKVIYFENEDSHGWKFHNVSMKTLLSFLSIFSGLPIQDRTYLKGKYDFALEIPDAPAQSAGAESGSPDDFTLVQLSLQGLGLKLSRSRVSINAVVVDHIERPTAN